MKEYSVVIAGAGPTGLMLAGELALAGVDFVILERRPSQEISGMRAGGLHARTLEILDQRGIAERFISQGTVYPAGLGFSMIPLHIRDFPTRHNYVLGLWQSHIERIMAEWLSELKVKISYNTEVTGFTQDENCVHVQLSNGNSLHAQYLVGCDGGRSFIRKNAGIEFPGFDPTTSTLIAEAQLAVEPPTLGIHRDARGIHAITKAEDGNTMRILVTEQEALHTTEPTLQDLSAALTAVYGTDYGVHSPASLTRFTDNTRQAGTYRARRVFLAGDAAHVHAPDGGQGAQLGMQDAMNLGWKLAQVIKGVSQDSLLDTYHAERHPVAARVLRNTMASVALRDDDDRTKALRETMTELLQLDEARKRMAGMLSGLDIRYDSGEGHPLLGRRMPDLEIVTSSGATRVYALLHDARFVFINFGESAIDSDAWRDRVSYVVATYDGEWELPVIGKVAAPVAVLVRPDGYVAWVGDSTLAGLRETVAHYFESPFTPA